MRPPFETFKGATCKGCYALGSACGHCEKCKWERNQMTEWAAMKANESSSAISNEVIRLRAENARLREKLKALIGVVEMCDNWAPVWPEVKEARAELENND